MAAVTDLQIPTAGLPLTVTRTYDSSRPYDGLFGPGWSSNLSARLFYATYFFSAPSTYKKEAVVTMPDGGRYRYAENAGGTTYTAPDLDVFFGANGRVSAVQDSSGRQVQYGYDTFGVLTSVTDPEDRITTYS